MLDTGVPLELAVQLGAGNALPPGSCRWMTRAPRSTLLSETTASQAEHFSCTQARCTCCQMRHQERLSPSGTKALAVGGAQDELQPPGSATAHGAAWPQAWAALLCVRWKEGAVGTPGSGEAPAAWQRGVRAATLGLERVGVEGGRPHSKKRRGGKNANSG